MYLYQWLESHARIRPHQTAILDAESGRRICYQELYQSTVTLANWLLGLGLCNGERVAVFASNCPEVLQLLFACARIGIVLVPVNTRLAAPEQRQILNDCQPRLLLVEPGFKVTADTDIPQKWVTEAVPPAWEMHPAAPAEAEQPLLILYTGGTTGVPKGAILTQRSLQWNAWNTIGGWGLRPDDIAPIFTPFFHTGGLNVLTTPLLCLGGTVVLPSRGSFEAEKALALMESERCTLLFLVPTMFRMLRDSAGYDPKRLSSVRMVVSGGAPCPPDLLEAYWKDGITLRQGYGLTEAGPNNFGIEDESVRRFAGSIGSPLPHVRVRLQRAGGGEALPDEVGELLISGPHLMSGYWQRAAETAHALRDGWLHTGDLARRDGQGNYYICGRSKEMFISGGENVFPAEIEAVLGSHPDVEAAAVVGVSDPRWGEVGRAYVVPRAGGSPDAGELAAFCRTRLAGYKVPKQFQMVEQLPRNPLGKVLKHLLKDSPNAVAAQPSVAAGVECASVGAHLL